MTNFALSRKNMVDCQIHTAGVVDVDILNAFETAPRELFALEKLQHVAYSDENLDLGQGRFLMEPIIHAKMLQAVKPNHDDVVLDVACATGYSSFILSSLVSTVISVEHNKRHIDKATRLWEKLGVCNVVLEEGDLIQSGEKYAPYSLIIINGAVEFVPKPLLDQLAVGGRLVTVVCNKNNLVGQVTVFSKSENGAVSSVKLFDAGVPILKAFEEKSEFQF